MKRGYWIVIILIIVLFGILFFSDKIFDGGLIEPVNDSIVEEVDCTKSADFPDGCKHVDINRGATIIINSPPASASRGAVLYL